MIRLVEVAEFNWLTCPIDRNREIMATHFSPSEFEIIALSNQQTFPKNINTIYTTSGKLRKIISYLKLAFTKGDILHTRAWPECILIFLLWKIRNPKGKHVLTIHGLPIKRISYLSGMLLAKLADEVTVVSKVTQQEVKKAYGVKSLVIYNGIDSKKFTPFDHKNESLRVLYVGRLEPHKNPQYIVELSQKFPECDFYLYGDGSMKLDLDKISGSNKNIYIEGTVPFEKMPEIYSSADVFLFPTINEGFANVMLEAAASGLPIVCFDATSMPEFVEHGKNGYLARNLEEMASYLGKLISDENTRDKLSRGAREQSLMFDWEMIAKQYAEIYKKLCTK